MNFDDFPVGICSKCQLFRRLIVQMQMVIGKLRNAATARRAGQKADLHQIRLIDILQRDRLLADGRRKRLRRRKIE